MSDALINGRRIRIVDELSREDLDGPIDTSLPAVRVVEALDRVALERGEYPERLIVDNGPKFRSRQLDAWAYQNGVALHFIDPGKPIQNALTECYNWRMRDRHLNMNWWPTLSSAQAGIRKWRQRYNTEWPHGSLGKKTPEEFAAHHRAVSSQAVPT